MVIAAQIDSNFSYAVCGTYLRESALSPVLDFAPAMAKRWGSHLQA